MKKIFFYFVGAMFLTQSFAQNLVQPKIMLRSPFEANGFIVLNKTDFPDVESWEVTIQRLNPLIQGRLETIYSKNIAGSFYDYINPNSLLETDILTIKGFNNIGDVVITDAPALCSNCVFTQPACAKLCVGPSYAYELAEYYTQLGRVLQVEQPFNFTPPNGFSYFYEWYSPSAFPAGPTPLPSYYYGLPNLFYNPGSPNEISGQMIDYIIPPGQILYTRLGDPLVGQAIGIAKPVGIYAGYKSTFLAQTQCDLTVGGMVNVINAYPVDTSQSTLVCESSINLANGGAPNEPFTGGVGSTVRPCILRILDNFSVNGNIYTYNYVAIPCDQYSTAISTNNGNGNSNSNGNGANLIGPAPFVWPSYLYQVSFENFDTGTKTIVNKASYFDVNDNLILNNTVLQPGLYRITYGFNDGSITSVYTKNANVTTSSVTQANCVNYGVNPVPITHNWFRLNVQATQNVEFKYELKNMNGIVTHTENIKIDKNRSINKKISPDNGLPNGQYVNVLTFADGSVINFMTVK